jgi:molecular chaperone HtpG
MDLFFHEAEHGIHLYIRRVFIMNDCKELIPPYLRFIKGVVDSEDLSLNISREILQQNRQIQVIRKSLTNKVLDTLREMKEKNFEKYLTFWKEFGKVLKEGLFFDFENKEKILPLLLFQSTNSPDELTDLNQYLGRMKEEQKAIYYLTGKSREAVENSPHLEALKDRGYEVLLLTDAVDEVWVQSVPEFQKKLLQSVGKGSVEVGSDEEKEKAKKDRDEAEKNYKSLLEFLKGKLDAHIKDVRLSTRLTSSPVCLVGENHDMTPQLEELMRRMGQEVPVTKRILEVNASHPVLAQLQKRFEADSNDPLLADYAELLYGEALLAEGNLPPDPGRFSKIFADLMARAI